MVSTFAQLTHSVSFRKVTMLAVLDHFRGQGYKTRLLNPHDEFWDQRLGVRTFGFHPGSGKQGDSDWRIHYTPTPYSDIFRLLKKVGLHKDDVFTDLGSGMGRAVFCASWMGAKRAVGIEVVPDLCETATQSHLRSRLVGRNIEFNCTNALNYQSRDTTVLFMFHPFGEATLRQVLHNIEAERMTEPRAKLRIIYVNPVFDAVLQQTKWLECIGHVAGKGIWPSTTTHYETSLWQSL
jgi:hypothetical protein